MDDLEDVPARVRRGDRGAFRGLVDATHAALVRMVARILGDLHRAEDVVQESYVKAYRAMQQGTFDGRASVVTWLHRIATNGAIDVLRARRPTEALADDPPAADGVEAGLALREVARWMADLPPEQRVTLVLSALEGKSNGEIAAILGCSEGAVEQRLVRARVALRRRAEAP